ncbi:MAG TPA: hypothetical protein VMI06_06545 [Terriglobia bacterium]|nr:hypothetical protein [Terriglobia bacterium]
MRSILTAASLAVCLCAGMAAQDSGATRPGHLVMEKALAAGGTVVLTLNVGDLKVLPVEGDRRVRLEIDTRGEVDRQTVSSWVTRFDVAGDRATLDIRTPKNRHNCENCDIEVVLYVPAQSALELNVGVGDVTIRGVRGDKDLHVDVGDLKIALSDPDDYGHVETRTRIGDVNDFLNKGGESGFLGKSEDFSLHGRFHLKATVGIGDLDVQHEGNS